MESESTSEFNMAVEYLRTLRTLLNICDTASSQLDLPTWYSALLSLRRELSDDMLKEEFETAEKYKSNLSPEIEKIKRYQTQKGINPPIKNELYDTMDSFEIFLRKVLNRAGYKTKRISPPERSLKA